MPLDGPPKYVGVLDYFYFFFNPKDLVFVQVGIQLIS